MNIDNEEQDINHPTFQKYLNNKYNNGRINIEKLLKQDYLKRDDAFSSTAPASVSSTVNDIINDVVSRGDVALKEYTERFDKCTLDSIQVTEQEIEFALNEIEDSFISILKSYFLFCF